MASIFLSYAREDANKAKALANCLERAGHSVWWDRHIHGGSDYSGVIEATLRDADIVLVLWSHSSVRSGWVRDEAAEGRDNGRLVPILLDDSTPHLGFRHIQSIALAGWSGRGNPPHLREILAAIAERSGADDRATGDAPPPFPPRRRALLAGLAALVALLVAAGAWWLLEGRGQASETPVLAVLPFSDLSPQGDKAYFAEGVAEAILTVLGREPGIRVIGRSTARQLQEAGAEAERMRREFGVTHVLEGSARSAGDQLRMSVRLIDASDGQQLWAEEYQRQLDNVFAVQDEIGRAVALRLKGSIASTSPAQRQLTTADAYTLYLAARAKMRDRRTSSLREALNMAGQVIAADPKYAPGHALYAELLWHMSVEAYGNLPLDRVRELAGPHARRAIQLAPNAADGYAALGLMSTGEEAIRAFSRAVQLDPARSELRLWLARAHETVGNNERGLDQLRAAAEMDPLFAPVVWNYVWWLASSGRYDEAEQVIRQFEQRGGSRAVAARMRGEIASYYGGDYGRGVALVHEALRLDPEVPLGRSSLALGYEIVGLHRQAVAYSDVLPTYTRLKMTGDVGRLVAQAKRERANLWKQPDVDVPLRALAKERDWASIEWLFDNNPQRGTLCTTSVWWRMQMLVDLATALDARGRQPQAAQLLGCVKRHLTAHGRGATRAGSLPGHQLELLWAEVHALEGWPRRAFERLDSAIGRGARTQYGAGLSEFPAFDRYRGSAEYRTADARLKQLIAEDRAEVLRMLAAQRPPERRAA